MQVVVGRGPAAKALLSPAATDNRFCLRMKTKEKEWNERINILFEQITYWIHNKTNKTVEIIQLYYDAFC